MNEMTWGMPVAIYLFLAGLGAGSFCLGAIASTRKGYGWEACARMAFMLAPPSIVSGLLMLILDLRYPTRFWRTLTVLNLESPMSIGVWLLSAFFIVSMISAIFWLPASVRRRIPLAGRWSVWNQRKWKGRLAAIGIPLALGISVYTGVLLSVTVIPLWRSLSLPILFFLSALSLGIEGGAILGMASLRQKNLEVMREPLRFLKRSYRIILPLYLLAALLFALSLAVSSSSRAAALRFMTGWSGFLWWVGVVVIGIVLPLILIMGQRKDPMRRTWVFSSCLLFGDFLLRLVLILAGQGAI
jgi:polysulfide reductase chain C